MQNDMDFFKIVKIVKWQESKVNSYLKSLTLIIICVYSDKEIYYKSIQMHHVRQPRRTTNDTACAQNEDTLLLEKFIATSA